MTKLQDGYSTDAALGNEHYDSHKVKLQTLAITLDLTPGAAQPTTNKGAPQL